MISDFHYKTIVRRYFIAERNASYSVLCHYLEKQYDLKFIHLLNGKLSVSYSHYNDGYLFEAKLSQYAQKGMTFLFKNPYKQAKTLFDTMLTQFVGNEEDLFSAKQELIAKDCNVLKDVLSLPYSAPVFLEEEINKVTLSDLETALKALGSMVKDEWCFDEEESSLSHHIPSLSLSIENSRKGPSSLALSFSFDPIKTKKDLENVMLLLSSYSHSYKETLHKRYALKAFFDISFSSLTSAVLCIYFSKELPFSYQEIFASLPSLSEEDTSYARREREKAKLMESVDYDIAYSSFRLGFDLGLKDEEDEMKNPRLTLNGFLKEGADHD